MYRTKISYLATLLLFTAGCQAAPDRQTEGLTLTVNDQDVEGTFVQNGDLVKLSAVESEPMVFDITVEVNEMVLDGLLDWNEGVAASLDGFASDNGQDTQMTSEDRTLLLAAYRALNDQLGKDIPPAAKALRKAVGLWAEHPSTLDLTRDVLGEEGRTIQYLCSYAYCGTWDGACTYWNWYTYATHDCCYGGLWGVGGHCTDRYDSDTSQIGQLGNHYSCSGDTWVWTGSAWACGEPDHWTYPYEVGNCFGRCGDECGGDTAYTKDCTDHDGCVRNGHETASAWCDDEFTSASDDFLSGSDCY